MSGSQAARGARQARAGAFDVPQAPQMPGLPPFTPSAAMARTAQRPPLQPMPISRIPMGAPGQLTQQFGNPAQGIQQAQAAQRMASLYGGPSGGMNIAPGSAAAPPANMPSLGRLPPGMPAGMPSLNQLPQGMPAGMPALTAQPSPQQMMARAGMPPGFTMSDARLKTDIKEVGRLMLPGGEVPISTFRFHGDPVRRMGIIAQHAEKVDPQAVFTHPVTGVKGLNYARVLLGAHQHAMGGGGGGNGR